MEQSDALSRRPDLCPEEDTDNQNRILLPELLFVNTIDIDLKEHIAKIKKMDPIVLEALTALQTNGPPPMQTSLKDWDIKEDLIFYKDKCYVPDDLDLRRNITQ